VTNDKTAAKAGTRDQADHAAKAYVFDLAPDGLALLEIDDEEREATVPHGEDAEGDEMVPRREDEENEETVPRGEDEAEPLPATRWQSARARLRIPEAVRARLDSAAAEEPPEKHRPTEGRQRSATWRPATVILILTLAAVSTFAIVQWRHVHALSAEKAERRALEQGSGRVASTFFNWDYQHMQASFDAKYALLTKSAADTIRPTASTLTTYFTSNKAMSTAHVNGIYPGEINGDAAAVVVAVDTRVTTSASIQTNTGATLLLSMKRVGGRWLANNIALTSPGQESYTDPKGKPITAPSSAGALPGARPSASAKP
jgi:hypothetical protein